MAERKPQFSCQADEELLARARDLKARIAESMGLPKISDSMLLRFAIAEMEKAYPAPTKSKRG